MQPQVLTSKDEEFLEKEKERAHNNKIKNKPILVITYFMVTVFVCMIGYVIYFMQFKSMSVIANSRNVRQDSFAETVERGDIITCDGVVIATSHTDEGGNTTREYPYSNMFAHVVGFDKYGKTGIELQANFYLLRSHINIFERIYNELGNVKNRGDNVITTIDFALQEAAYNALGNCKGAVIVMEPDTGKVLAMVSKPDFNPNEIDDVWEYVHSDEGSESTELLNRATQGLYAPGSTFKVVTLLEYIRENPYSYLSYEYNCSGSEIYAGVNIHCYDSTAHGHETLADSLAYSCNASFANIGMGLDFGEFNKTAEKLLFNSELPYENEYNMSEFVIDENSAKSEMPQTAIGQGNTRITPIHNLMIVSSIANGGALMRPYLVDKIVNDDGADVKKFQGKAYGNLMTSEEALILTDYMKGVCDYGTAARFFRDTPYDVAGKTGTAEYDNEGNCNSWFIGFSNPDNPDICISVVVEDYNSNGLSATSVAKSVFDTYYAK
ncbi:MAG: penicillin-binding protein 2 [Lachnospiraceae bacterium]|nr:penicillin-binding protein 2 [Lachnospiraceae bacterium]